MLSYSHALPILTLIPSLVERRGNRATWNPIRTDSFVCLARSWEMKQSGGGGAGTGRGAPAGHRGADYGCSSAGAESGFSGGSVMGSSAFLPMTDNQDTETRADQSQALIWGLIPDNQRWQFNARHGKYQKRCLMKALQRAKWWFELVL